MTRSLASESVLQELPADKFAVKSQSLLEFTYLPFSLPTDVDWIFFYSQHGATAFFQTVSPSELNAVKLAAFGPKTAAVVRSYAACQFVGDGKGESTAMAFDRIGAGSRVVFARAENSLQSIQRRVKSIEVVDVVVYRNQIRKSVQIARHDVAVITSPLNARAYVQANKKDTTVQLIAIGESTKSVLVDLGMADVLVPEKPSEESIHALLLSLA